MSRGVLLDTQVLVSFCLTGNLLGKATQHLIRPPSQVFYSPISVAEIKLKEAVTQKSLMAAQALDGLATLGLRELPLDSKSAIDITRFPTLDRHDPFDRLLLGQAVNHNLLFISTDRLLVGLDLDFVHDASL